MRLAVQEPEERSIEPEAEEPAEAEAEPADDGPRDDGDERQRPSRLSRRSKQQGESPVTMVHPDQDEERMAKWCRELGPEKPIYREDE